ncbi:hypothetical protein BH10PSE13_BH10PSE13_04570 [soil metagenome]
MHKTGTRARHSLIVFTWDGGSLDHISQDAEPEFDILLFDFTGRASPPPGIDWPMLSQKTECKGDVLRIVGRHLRQEARNPEYVALFDHDIRTSIRDINRLIKIAQAEQLDSFAPALTHESYFSYVRFLSCGVALRPVRWVEVMMPFYRTELFLAGQAFYEDSITAYGIDSFVIPMFQKVLGMNNVAIVDSITVTHTQPVSSGRRVMSHGLTPYEERCIARRRCIEWLCVNRSDLIGSRWFYKTFAPLDGPARFWLLRLAWPWHRARRIWTGATSYRRRFAIGG